MFNEYFVHSLYLEFRRSSKHWFYAWAYGSLKGKQVYQDFISMYLMGGEL